MKIGFMGISFLSIMALPFILSANDEQKRVIEADNFNEMFTYSSLDGDLRTIYGRYNFKEDGVKNIYSTAIGGHLKYELAPLNGFNGAIAFSTSHDIRGISANNDKQNPEYSSSDNHYTTLSEAYVNYKYDGLNLRAGRQKIDTPLADSDDIRIIYNTFEAYVATYELDNFNIMAGKLLKWQGYDADLDNGWSKTGENGTNFGGINFESEHFDASAWYYNITKFSNALYADTTLKYDFTSDITSSLAFQYLQESELNNSGTKAKIYGAMAEVGIKDLTFNLAYNESKQMRNKESFSGFGGGALFTNMDTMILDEITADRKAKAMVGGISYNLDDLTLSYAYGDFKGKRDSNDEKAHISEQNLALEYNFIESGITLRAIYVQQRDKQSSVKTANDWDRFELMASYSF